MEVNTKRIAKQEKTDILQEKIEGFQRICRGFPYKSLSILFDFFNQTVCMYYFDKNIYFNKGKYVQGNKDGESYSG